LWQLQREGHDVRTFHRVVVVLASVFLLLPRGAALASSTEKILPQGSRIYLVTDKEVTSKRGESDVGTVVPCRVWRDVEHEGTVFVKGGAVAACRVEKVKRRNMGGKEGEIAIGGVDTRSIDGQQIMLSGGYNKEGSGRKAVVWTVGLLLLWPVLFVPGGQAELPPGTVFDVTTVNDLRLKTETTAAAPARINLSSLAGGLSAEVMLDDLLSQKKPETLRLKLSKDAPMPTELFVDSVNGKTVDAIPIKLVSPVETDGTVDATGEIRLKPLANHFKKGINRFEVSYKEGDARQATEVILDVQM
jgi:hypothetical protein